MNAIDEGGVWCRTCLHPVHDHGPDGCWICDCAHSLTPPCTPTPARGDFSRALAEVEDDLDPQVTLHRTTSGAYADLLIIGPATPAARIAAVASIAGQLAVDVNSFTVSPSTEDDSVVHVRIATRWRNVRLSLTTIIRDVPAAELDGILAPLHALTTPGVGA